MAGVAIDSVENMKVCMYILGKHVLTQPKSGLNTVWDFVCMPDLVSTGSETHESAIKKTYLCICAYGSSGSIDIQSMWIHMNMYICIYLHTYTYILYVCLYRCINLSTYVCIHFCVNLVMYVCVCMCMCIHVCMYICMDHGVYMNHGVCMYICMDVSMYVCVSWFSLGDVHIYAYMHTTYLLYTYTKHIH